MAKDFSYQALFNGLVFIKDSFNFNGVDVFTTPDDHILDPADDAQVAIFVKRTQVPYNIGTKTKHCSEF